jgi:hypothetical protein
MEDEAPEIPEDWCPAMEIAKRAGVPWSMVLMYAGRFPDRLPSRKAKNGRRWFPPDAVEIIQELSKLGKGKREWKRK